MDLFAGGGGASTGIEAAIRRPVDVAINHDPAAIAMHSANHPNTKHYCEDVFAVSPREACGNRKVGLLWASPACTHFSKAKGCSNPLSGEIRSLAWVVVQWAREVSPRVIALENVEEFLGWGPLDADGYPIPERKGEDFCAFVAALSDARYKVEWRTMVAADYGSPTTRKRLFMLAKRDGGAIAWPTPTHGVGRRSPWRSAASIIDFNAPSRSIFGRAKPLAEATMRRIAAGMKRFVFETGDPFVVPLTHHGGQKHGLVAAFLAKHYGGPNGNQTPGISMEQPVGTVTTVDHHALVEASFVSKFYGTSTGSAMLDPLPTVTATGQHLAAVHAFMIKYYGAGVGQAVGNPLHTITTRDRFGLVTVHGVAYQIVDIRMRMLNPRELFNAQGFPRTYIIDPDLNGKPLSKTEQIAKAGNSVCPQLSEALVAANGSESYASVAA